MWSSALLVLVHHHCEFRRFSENIFVWYHNLYQYSNCKKKKKKKRERKKNRQGMLEMLSFGKYFAKPSNDNLALENRSGP